MGLSLITPPATTPVTLADAKAHLEYQDTDRDSMITALVAAATDYVEQWTGKALIAQTWRLTLDAFTDSIQIPKNPVQSVTALTYYDTLGVLQTVGAGDYTADTAGNPAWLVINSNASWPAIINGVNMVRIDFVAGYTIIPPSFKHAILLLIGQWFDHRSGVSDKAMSEVPHAVESLLRPYRDVVV